MKTTIDNPTAAMMSTKIDFSNAKLLAEFFKSTVKSGAARLVKMSLASVKAEQVRPGVLSFSTDNVLLNFSVEHYTLCSAGDWAEDLEDQIAEFGEEEEQQVPWFLFLNVGLGGTPPQWLHIQVRPGGKGKDCSFKAAWGVSDRLVTAQIRQLFASVGTPLLNAAALSPDSQHFFLQIDSLAELLLLLLH